VPPWHPFLGQFALRTPFNMTLILSYRELVVLQDLRCFLATGALLPSACQPNRREVSCSLVMRATFW
jgi:hypothetical protein